MIGLALLFLLAVWIALDYMRDHLAFRREELRRIEKAAMHQRLLATLPDSPTAYERYGDALRGIDDPAGAVAAYERAMELGEQARLAGGGVGTQASGGIENKLRLARLDLATIADPHRFGQTLQTRQQFCRSCGLLGQPDDRACTSCGAPLPANTMLDTLRNRTMRSEIQSEVGQTLLKFTLIFVAIAFTASMPLVLRVAIFVSAVIVVPLRILKKLGEG